MSIRIQELLALTALGCCMIIWIVGAAIGFFSRVSQRADLGNADALLTLPALGLVECASLVILVVVVHLFRAIRREAPAPMDEP